MPISIKNYVIFFYNKITNENVIYYCKTVGMSFLFVTNNLLFFFRCDDFIWSKKQLFSDNFSHIYLDIWKILQERKKLSPHFWWTNRLLHENNLYVINDLFIRIADKKISLLFPVRLLNYRNKYVKDYY